MKNTYRVMSWHCLKDCYTDDILINVEAEDAEAAKQIVMMKIDWNDYKENAPYIELEAELVHFGPMEDEQDIHMKDQDNV